MTKKEKIANLIKLKIAKDKNEDVFAPSERIPLEQIFK